MSLYFGQSIAGMGLPMAVPVRLASAPLVLLIQQGCGFQRTRLNNYGHGLFLSLLERLRVLRRMNNRHPSPEEWFERERRDIVEVALTWL